MTTECTQSSFGFHPLHGREVVAHFDGGDITSDAGGLLLREVERRTGIVRQLAGCFTDHRRSDKIEHSVEELLAQRIYGLALGYEDLNDHDQLRRDPLMAVLVGKAEPKGTDRRRGQDEGKAGAGKSTLNRLELTPADATSKARYKKVVMDDSALDRLLVDLFLQAHAEAPRSIVLDLDATDDPVHGHQEGRFFHGYYGAYCYLPLYIFCGGFVLCARLRSSNIDASAGCLEELQRIIPQIRQQWPEVEIVLRGDGGFCRDPIMTWCEANQVRYVFGLAKNQRLKKIIGRQLHEAEEQFRQTGKAARVFTEFGYQTRKSWLVERRVVAKAEHLDKGANPRFVVTSLPAEQQDARSLYEDLCARRHGKPHKRTTTWVVCGSHFHLGPALQSTPVVLFLFRLLPAASLAAAGIEGNRNGAGAVPDDPPEAAQGGRADPCHCAQGLDLPGGRVSVRGDLCSSLRQPDASPTATVLTLPRLQPTKIILQLNRPPVGAVAEACLGFDRK
jgi:hypothetical protein